jgi:hypothetical protein
LFITSWTLADSLRRKDTRHLKVIRAIVEDNVSIKYLICSSIDIGDIPRKIQKTRTLLCMDFDLRKSYRQLNKTSESSSVKPMHRNILHHLFSFSLSRTRQQVMFIYKVNINHLALLNYPRKYYHFRVECYEVRSKYLCLCNSHQ